MGWCIRWCTIRSGRSGVLRSRQRCHSLLFPVVDDVVRLEPDCVVAWCDALACEEGLGEHAHLRGSI